MLSFPAKQRPRPRGRTAAPAQLGDIVIAYQTTAREARAEGKPLKHHLAHLAVHGFLHLLGYDHENDRDAENDGTARARNPRGGSACPILTPSARSARPCLTRHA